MRVFPLPCDDDGNGWHKILPPPPPATPLRGDRSADWAVVGAGVAGLAAARRLAELRPGQRIALIEAQRVGLNASGRNSGFVIDLPHGVAFDDEARDRRQMRLSRAAIADLRALVRAHRIDCQWSERGKVHAAATALGERSLDDYARGLERLGEAHDALDAARCARMLGTGYYRAGVFTPGCVLMQPAALVRGLAGSLPASVTLFEETPVVGVDYGEPVRLQCPQGTLRAGGLILATNGFTSGFGFFRGRLMMIATYGSLTRPLSEAEAAALGGEADWGIIPARPWGTTLRYTRDRRILVRNVVDYTPGGRAPRDALARARRHHRRSFVARFPMLPEVGLEHTWGGQLCLSHNGAPAFGRIAGNVFAAACQNGVGVARGTIAGRLAAELALGEDSDLLADQLALGQPSAYPPRPFLDLGVLATMTWRRLRAGREH